MKTPKWIKKTARFIKEQAIPGTFEIYPCTDPAFWKWKYEAPCECGNPQCRPETRSSCGAWSKEEMESLKSFYEGLCLK